MPSDYKADFPIFTTHPQLVYLDSAASAQKPAAVIEAVSEFYRSSYANIHRGIYGLSEVATERFEAVRSQVADFIKADSFREIIFTKSATESLNLLASSLEQQISEGEEIILSELEHHANLIPWQQLAKRTKAQIRFVSLTQTGEIDLAHFRQLLTPKTKLVSFSHCSNVLGSFTALAEVKKIMREEESSAFLIADASQSIAHIPLAVHDLEVDFLVFSSHKLYGPSGVGILWGKEQLLQQLPPYQTGGDMIKTVTLEAANWNDLPWKFEAGTLNIEGVIGLGAALTYLQAIGMSEVQRHISALSNYALQQLRLLPEVTILGTPHAESGLISFTVQGIHPHDLASLLAERSMCIRAGQHCAAPLHQQLGLVASNRISFALYTTSEDIDSFAVALAEIISDFSHV